MRISPVVQSLTEPLLSPLVSAITGVIGGGFNPQQFFKDGSIGVLYDNNDLTSFYLDAAGTTAATVNGLVGLQLDKSQGLVLGAEVIPQPLDLTGSGWATVGTLFSVSSNGFVNGSGSGAGRAYTITTGKWYRVEVTYTKNDATTVFGIYDNSASTPIQTATSASGKLSGTYLSTGVLYLRLGGNGNVTINSISLKEIAGNHRYQTTTGSKPILRGTPTGANLVTNGDFASATGWTLGTGITISGGTLNFATATNDWAGQTISTSSGRVYRVTLNVTSYTSGAPYVTIGGGSLVNIPSPSTIGQKVLYVTAGSADAFFRVYGGGFGTGGTCSIDNIDVRDVSAGSVTAPYGLQYDGVDDFMQTASVNFSATDKMFVVAGVRKLSDAAVGVLAELSATSLNTGAFAMFAPSAAGTANYGWRAHGSNILGVVAASGFASPITNVVSGIANIASDSRILRANGSQVAIDTAEDMGTGNFRNDIIYFGRRAGTSNPFNGLDFGLCIVGKTLTASQIANTERWIAQRTGVTL